MNITMKRALLAALLLGIIGGVPRLIHADKNESGREKFAERMKARIKEKLELTDDQASKLEAAYKTHREAAKALREKQKANMEKLAEQVEAKASDKEITATLDSLDAGRKEMASALEKMKASSESILKPLQRAKLRLAMGKMMKRHGRGGWRGHRRHHDNEDDD